MSDAPELDDREVEQWRPVVGFPAYEVSSLGRVRRGDRVLGLKVSHRGYSIKQLYSRKTKKYRTVFVHRLVYESFVGPLAGLQVNHIDCNKLNNRPSNLEAVTAKQNMEHARDAGLLPSGQRHYLAAKPTCLRGHAFAGDNLYILPNSKWRGCRQCRRIGQAAWRAKRNGRHVAE